MFQKKGGDFKLRKGFFYEFEKQQILFPDHAEREIIDLYGEKGDENVKFLGENAKRNRAESEGEGCEIDEGEVVLFI